MAAPQQGNQSDNSTSILWGVAALFFAIGFIWFAFKKYLVMFYLTIKLYQANFLGFFSTDHANQLRSSLLPALQNVEGIKFADLIQMGSATGDWFRFPFAILLFVLAIVVYFGNTTRIFKRSYNMRDLVKTEKGIWPQIIPIADLDLVKTDIDVGPWSMAMTPMQFCKRYKLLEEFRPERHEGMSRKDWDKIEVKLKRGDANKIFALQLGPIWRGVDHLPPHVRALFAVFAARINADSQAAIKLLAQLNRSSSTKLDMSGVDHLLKKYGQTKDVQKVVQSHAYVFTVMASMLEHSREDGVQASADFLWLKPMDRRLWYILNSVGRQTPFVEVGGIFAHWVAEKESGRKLFVPIIDEATNALELALKEVIYRPDEAVSS